MKKNSALYIVLTAFISSIIAKGVVLPRQERPVFFAVLTEIDTQGNEFLDWSQKQTLTMNQRHGAQRATSFMLSEVRNTYCVKTPCPPARKTTLFFVDEVDETRCGSLTYMATEFSPDEDNAVAPQKRLQVIDHRTRLCEDRRPDVWDVTLSDGNFVRVFAGHPETVYTIQ